MPNYTLVELTDGVTGLELSGIVSTTRAYELTAGGWAPAVYRDDDPLAVVEEVITIDLGAGASTTAMTRAEALQSMLTQARRWADGDTSATLIRLRVHLQNSTLAQAVEAVVVGGTVEFAGSFIDLVMFGEVPAVQVRILRRAFWSVPIVTTATTGATAQGTVMTATLATHPTLSPVRLRLQGWAPGTTGTAVPTWPAGFVAWAPAALYFDTLTGADFTATGAYTKPADATNLPHGAGNVILRYTPTGTTAATITSTNGIDLAVNLRRVACFAAIRNNTVGKTYTVQPYLDGGGVVSWGTPTTVEYTDGLPRIVYLGNIAVNANASFGGLSITAASTGGTLDIDLLAYCAVDVPGTGIVANDAFTVSTLPGTAGAYSIDPRVWVSNVTNGQDPFVGAFDTGGTEYSRTNELIASYRGVAVPMQRGTAISVLWLATSHLGPYWRPVRADNSALAPSLSVSRWASYRSPQ